MTFNTLSLGTTYSKVAKRINLKKGLSEEKYSILCMVGDITKTCWGGHVTTYINIKSYCTPETNMWYVNYTSKTKFKNSVYTVNIKGKWNSNF